jgi:peptidoglycan/xylan/chitin deacetylase (PgdA/CDA1 family)
VLKTLADECTKAVFFPIGKHATYHPEILKQVVAAGHSVGAHTWSHANLNSKKMNKQQARDEIEKGFSAVKLALGAAPSPFFRFPQLQHSPAAVSYLGSRNVAIFSCDVDSFDFKAKDATQVINSVLTKLEKSGKGIILMHDFQKHTAEALPALLRRLKAGGYKVVQMKAKAPLQTLAEYDEALVNGDVVEQRRCYSRVERCVLIGSGKFDPRGSMDRPGVSRARTHASKICSPKFSNVNED